MSLSAVAICTCWCQRNHHLGVFRKQLKVFPVPAEACLPFSFLSPIQPACLPLKDVMATVMSERHTSPQCKRMAYTSPKHFTQTCAHFQAAIFIALPQCPGAGATQATQLQSLHLPPFLNI